MYLKVIVIGVLICSVQGNSDCKGFFECTRNLFKNFFSGEQDTVVYKVDNKNKNISRVTDVDIIEVDRVLKDLSKLLNTGGDEKLESRSALALFKNFENKTQIYVNFIEFDTDLTDVSDKNETYIDHVDNSTNIVDENTTRFEEVKDLLEPKEDLNNEIKTSVKKIKQNEIINYEELNYYDEHDDNSTDYPIIDYVDFYKDTTNEEYVYVQTESTIVDDSVTSDIEENKVENNFFEITVDSYVDFLNRSSVTLVMRYLQEESLTYLRCLLGYLVLEANENKRDGSIEAIFPWIVTIFIKNDSENDQFSYYCDGALLTETKILTAATCVNFSNSILKPEDLLVVLGKSSLQQMADRETVRRINQIIIHERFTNDDDGVENDLAVLIMDEPIKFTKYIKATNISNEEDFKGIEHSATTAWAITGRLEPILFEKVEYMSCINDVVVENGLCATYGYDVALCPSYGGLFAVRRRGYWQLEGIMSGNPSKRGICFNKSVTYTYLENYLDWIRDMIDI